MNQVLWTFTIFFYIIIGHVNGNADEDELLMAKCNQILKAAHRHTVYDSFAETVLAFKYDGSTLANENGMHDEIGPLIQNATQTFLSIPESDLLGSKLLDFIQILKLIRNRLATKAPAVELIPLDIPIHYLLVLCKENGDLMASIHLIESHITLNNTKLTSRFINLLTTSYMLGEYLGFNPSNQIQAMIDSGFSLDNTDILGRSLNHFISSIQRLRRTFLNFKATPEPLERIDTFLRLLGKAKTSKTVTSSRIN